MCYIFNRQIMLIFYETWEKNAAKKGGFWLPLLNLTQKTPDMTAKKWLSKYKTFDQTVQGARDGKILGLRCNIFFLYVLTKNNKIASHLFHQCKNLHLSLHLSTFHFSDELHFWRPLRLLDWVHVKTYDFYGSWNTYTGHNSPLYPASVENNWEKNHLNIQAAAKNWMAFGIPKSKMILSVAFYGRSFTLKDRNQHGLHAPIVGAGPGDDSGFIRYSEVTYSSRSWFNCDKYYVHVKSLCRFVHLKIGLQYGTTNRKAFIRIVTTNG